MMKYIAIFDVPDGYGIGCAVAKVAPKGKERYDEEDLDNAYAQVEPLSEEKADVFERFNTVDRVLNDLGISNAYDMPRFWSNTGKNYTVIQTKYHKGYMQALEDVEQEVRKRFGFAKRDNVPMLSPFEKETL
jgi:hypothetical protein